ncbi:unnamed protein product [Blepharisma stoltei]|uniref:Uncharacterized protein n=1 Tax=Blepharisma stoltei TaxID=1481888 RepID=A0AAU9JC72_9CILI|nr:unnamed protein product [Blepharisma stoltei]
MSNNECPAAEEFPSSSELNIGANLSMTPSEKDAPSIINGGTPKQRSRKSSSISNIPMRIEDMLKAKDEEVKARITTLRMLKNAEERRSYTAAPQINPNSKKILKNSKRAIEDKELEEKLAIEDGDKVDTFQEYKNFGAEIKIPYESLKESLKNRCKIPVETEEEKVDTSKMTLVERNLYWAKKKNERIEKERISKEKVEMSACTFKPVVSPRMSTSSSMSSIENIASKATKYSNSIYSAKRISSPISESNHKDAQGKSKPSMAEQKQARNLRIPPPNPIETKQQQAEKPEKNIAEPFVSPNYAQLTPVCKNYKFKQGFNYDKMKSQAKPMVRYGALGN